MAVRVQSAIPRAVIEQTRPYVVANLATLKALPYSPAVVETQGYTTAGDGGGGPPWDWNSTSTTTADDFLVVQRTGVTTGRYIRRIEYGGAVSPKWGGAGLGRTAKITNITTANPAVVTTSTAHGLTTGDSVLLFNVLGMEQVNNLAFTATVLTTTTFSIGINTAASVTLATSGGTSVSASTAGAVLLFSDTSSLAAGMYPSGTNIHPGCTIRSIVPNTSVTLTAPIFDTVSGGASITFTTYGPYTSGGTVCTVTDDTTRMAVIKAAPGAHPVDFSGCTVPATAITHNRTDSCPGFFSDGSGVITAAPGTSSATYLCRTFANDFFVDKMTFIGPISTDKYLQPRCGKLFVVEYTQFTVTAVTKATQGQVTTSAAHGFSIGQQVYFLMPSGMTELDGRLATVMSVPSSTTFTIDVDTTAYTTFASGTAYPSLSNHKVTNCTFVGASTAVLFDILASSRFGRCTGNHMSYSWGNAVTSTCPREYIFTGNTFYRCAWGPDGVDSVTRFVTTNTKTFTENLVIANNIYKECVFLYPGWTTDERQEAIDMSGYYARNVLVANNVIDQVNNGFIEWKTDSVSVAPGFYGDALLTGNKVMYKRLGPYTITDITKDNPAVVTVSSATPHPFTNGNSVYISGVSGMTQINDASYTVTRISPLKFSIGVDTSGGGYSAYTSGGTIVSAIGTGVVLNNNGAADHQAKGITISGNKFTCDVTGRNTTAGVVVTFWDRTVISGNTMDVGGNGISIVGSLTQPAYDTVIKSNTIRAEDGGIICASGLATKLCVDSNDIIATLTAIRFNGGTITDLVLSNNPRLESPATTALNLRNIQGGKVFGNNVSGVTAIGIAGTACTNLKIFRNELTSTNDDAIQVDVAPVSAEVYDNNCNIPLANRIVAGVGVGATLLCEGNTRGFATADPTATTAGSIGDRIRNSAVATGVTTGWRCTTAGNIGASVYKAEPVMA